jgi:Fe-S cluster assembly protein SufB
VGAQYDSEVVYHNLQQQLADKGVVFSDPETAVQEYPEIVQKYFGTIIPYSDNKFAALNSAVWSGGSFVYVPKGVKVDIPLQAYFRINSQNFGQFERTLIICEEDSFVHYIEGCTAPIYTTDSLHSAVVEIVALPGARVRYTTIQNWSSDVYNLVTKRAVAHERATVEWVDGNIGSKRTMKYPSVYLMGEGAHGEVLSIAFAGQGQEQDTGAKMVHAASNTSSVVTSKSISKDGGTASYRGQVKVDQALHNVRSHVVCDALILDPESTSNTYPYMDINAEDVSIEHEARVSRISEEQLFYLMSRGMSEEEASMMIVNGFLDPLVKQLPMEYAVELNRLIELEMEGSVG